MTGGIKVCAYMAIIAAALVVPIEASSLGANPPEKASRKGTAALHSHTISKEGPPTCDVKQESYEVKHFFAYSGNWDPTQHYSNGSALDGPPDATDRGRLDSEKCDKEGAYIYLSEVAYTDPSGKTVKLESVATYPPLPDLEGFTLQQLTDGDPLLSSCTTDSEDDLSSDDEEGLFGESDMELEEDPSSLHENRDQDLLTAKEENATS